MLQILYILSSGIFLLVVNVLLLTAFESTYYRQFYNTRIETEDSVYYCASVEDKGDKVVCHSKYRDGQFTVQKKYIIKQESD